MSKKTRKCVKVAVSSYEGVDVIIQVTPNAEGDTRYFNTLFNVENPDWKLIETYLTMIGISNFESARQTISAAVREHCDREARRREFLIGQMMKHVGSESVRRAVLQEL
jgi:hypothetical protein